MDGVLFINKDVEMTSFDVIRQLRRLTHEKSIGHTGTLDPNASGLLICLFGHSTKILPYINHDDKEYVATFEFGQKSDTADIWGTIIEEKEVNLLPQEEFEKVLNSFIGESFQIPPMYSAIKQNGKKLYDLARAGITVEREPRKIYISKLELCAYSRDEVKIDCIVSGGTYIRTLIEDIAEATNNLATMTSLKRVGIGSISLKDSISLSEVNENTKTIDPLVLLRDLYPIVEVDNVEDVKNGKQIVLNHNEDMVVLVRKQELLAIYTHVGGGVYKCKRGLW